MAKRDKLIEAISTGAVDAREVKADLDAAITKRDAIQAELTGADAEPKLVEPGMSERYRAAVGQLIDGFADEETQDEAMRCIRSLIDKIVVRPNAAGDDLDVDLHGALATILLLAIEDESRFIGKNITDFAVKRAEARAGKRSKNQRNDAKTGGSKVPVKQVSQAGLEPATRPL